MRLGLISNRLSGANRSGLPAPSLGAGVSLVHRPVEGLSGLAEAFDDLAAAEVEVIAVNGGDGTVSAVLTELLAKPRFATLPALALLCGGTLNMGATGLGLKGRPDQALVRLSQLSDWSAAATARSVIGLRRGGGEQPLCGLFFAAAALYRAIQFCYRRVQPNSPSPRAAAGVTMALLLGRLAVRGARDDVLRPQRLSIALDDSPAEQLDALVTLVSALDSLVLNMRPFWGTEPGALHYTTLTYPPRGLLRRLRRVLYGGAGRRLPTDGYYSHKVDRIVMAPGGPFALDGEIYEAPSQSLEIAAAGPVRFVSC